MSSELEITAAGREHLARLLQVEARKPGPVAWLQPEGRRKPTDMAHRAFQNDLARHGTAQSWWVLQRRKAA